jgi:hypothetical protein
LEVVILHESDIFITSSRADIRDYNGENYSY